jgi:predicted nuclease with TOPRIM domain
MSTNNIVRFGSYLSYFNSIWLAILTAYNVTFFGRFSNAIERLEEGFSDFADLCKKVGKVPPKIAKLEEVIVATDEDITMLKERVDDLEARLNAMDEAKSSHSRSSKKKTSGKRKPRTPAVSTLDDDVNSLLEDL